MVNVQNLRGTRDFYPAEMATAKRIFNVWRQVSQKYGYEEVEGPIIESAQMWRIKSGAEIPDQMYVFKDKGDEEIAIRPEFTPTLARMVAARQKQLPKPIRWFTMPRCFRYEAPQKGRSREFFQYNIDLLGSIQMDADAEIIATAIDIMLAFGCTEKDFYVRLGNRKVINAMLSILGVKDTQTTCRLIDKIEKIKEREFKQELSKLCDDSDLLYTLITSKDWQSSLQLLAKKTNASKQDLELLEEGKQQLEQVLVFIDSYGFEEYIEVDLSIMRGFDYYTATVFEVFDRSKKFRSLAGGGRYDNLVGDFGGETCPGVGYAMGGSCSALEAFLQEKRLLPEYKRQVDYFIIPVTNDVREEATSVAKILRRTNTVEMEVMGRKLTKALNSATTAGATNVVIVGKKDLEQEQVTMRNLETGKEQQVKITEIEKL